MKNIAIRAWDKNHHSLYKVNQVKDLSNEDQIEVQTNENKNCYCFNAEEIELYVGINDVDGKPIYENDIVENEHGDIRVVQFHRGNYLVGGYLINSIGAGSHLKIVGNTHENPDLL